MSFLRDVFDGEQGHGMGVTGRIVFFPVALCFWALQLVLFTVLLGWLSVFLGLYMMARGYVEDGMLLVALPVLAPVVWWYRYILHGEYDILI